METKIAHNNKDLISKILADSFGSKSFAVYGLNIPPIVEYLPTELPAVEVTDRFADEIFRLEDDSYALVDFESEYRKANNIKYMHHIARITEKYFSPKEGFRLRLIVIYTGDVQSAESVFSIGCMTLKTDQAFLSHIDGDEEMAKIREKIESGQSLDDEDLMKLIILPLTYKGDGKKSEMIDVVIDSAAQIRDGDKQVFVLAGLCAAAQHYMTELQAGRIGGLIRKMNNVSEYIYNMVFQEHQEELLKLQKEHEQKLNKFREESEQERRRLEQESEQEKRRLEQELNKLQEKYEQERYKSEQESERRYEQSRLRYGDEQKREGIEDVARKLLLNGSEEKFVMDMTGLSQKEIDRILGREAATAVE